MENKERALKAAFPIPDSNTCSFASPSPGPDVLPSLLYLRTAQVASPCYSTLLRQHEEKQQQEQPPALAARGDAQQLLGEGTQSPGTCSAPHSQENGLA